jgi:hypothetical protein
MVSEQKLELCGLSRCIKKSHSYKYQGNEIDIDFDYDEDVIYVDITTQNRPDRIPYLIEQLLGRFKRCKLINVTAYDDEILLNYLTSKKITVKVYPQGIVIGRYDYPNIYHGVLRDCKIRLANKYTITHKQIIQVTNEDVFIYFDPPLIYNLSGASGDLSTYIETPISICGDPVIHWRPRWNKLRLCVDYDKQTYLHGTQTYVLRKKMKISLGPSKRGYEQEYKEYQTYARQILHYLNNRAKYIQRAWRRCISDPIYKVCRERLQNEYQDMKILKHIQSKEKWLL